MITDIVISTYNRLPLLKRTLEYLYERTTSAFHLHVIDDASTEGNREYLQGLLDCGMLAGAVLRDKRTHVAMNWHTAAWLANSDILVYSDDDVLVPRLDPDWLSRGLAAMAQYPTLGMLALENPSALTSKAIKPIRQMGPLMLCDRVASHFAFIRRDLMRSIIIPAVGEKLAGIPIYSNGKMIDRAWSYAVRERGYLVAYLRGVYCQHIGLVSGRTGQDLSQWDVPCDGETLEPIGRNHG
jgi:glycosyltransferase involved in cell wall biosynthesis